MRKIKIANDLGLFKSQTYTFREGVTVLVGKNGLGKTTLIGEIKDYLDSYGIPNLIYDNYYDGGTNAKEKYSFQNQMELVMLSMCSSEGQNIMINLTEHLRTIIKTQCSSNTDELWLLFDAIDSGLSIDNIIEIRERLFGYLLNTLTADIKKVYVVVTANTFELARDYDCINIKTSRHRTFKTYKAYKNFILRDYDETVNIEDLESENA